MLLKGCTQKTKCDHYYSVRNDMDENFKVKSDNSLGVGGTN